MAPLRRSMMLLLTSLLLLALGAGADGPGWDFNSRAAQAAKRKYAEAMTKANEDYVRRVRTLRDLATKELNDAMRAATRAGNLDEANLIKRAVEELAVDPVPPGAAGVVGRWQVTYTNGVRRDYDIRKDGTASWSDRNKSGRGKIERVGPDLMLFQEAHGAAERLTLAGDRLFVEHYLPAGRYPKDPADIMGVGQRIKPAP